MLNSILEAIIKIIFYIASFISYVFTQPIFVLIKAIYPDFSSYLVDATTYFTTYVLKGVAFAREAFINITRLPSWLISFTC